MLSLENTRRIENIELATNLERARKQTSKQKFKRFTKFSDNLYAIHKHKLPINLSKPIY